jgi:hypothetical protein
VSEAVVIIRDLSLALSNRTEVSGGALPYERDLMERAARWCDQQCAREAEIAPLTVIRGGKS